MSEAMGRHRRAEALMAQADVAQDPHDRGRLLAEAADLEWEAAALCDVRHPQTRDIFASSARSLRRHADALLRIGLR